MVHDIDVHACMNQATLNALNQAAWNDAKACAKATGRLNWSDRVKLPLVPVPSLELSSWVLACFKN